MKEIPHIIPICDGDEFAFSIRKENQLAEEQLSVDNNCCPNWWYTVKRQHEK